MPPTPLDIPMRQGFLLESIPGVAYVFEVRPDGARRFTDISRRVEDFFGYSRDEVLADPDLLFRIVHDDDKAELEAAIAASMAGMERFASELRMRAKNGSQRWMHAESLPERLEDGTVRWTGVAVDITGRKQAEEDLRRSEERHRRLFDQAGVFFSVWDATGRCLMINRKAAEAFGAEPEALQGKTMTELHPAMGSEYQGILTDVAATGAPRQVEFEVAFPTGPRWLITTASPVRDAQGGTVAVHVVSVDATARRRAERELADKTALLEQIVNATPDWLAVKDKDLRFAMVNRAMAAFYGLAPEDMVGLRSEDVAAEEDAALYAEHDHEVLTTGRPLSLDEHAAHDDREQWMQVAKTPLKNTDGQVDGLLLAAKDVSGRRRMEQRLAENEARLRLVLEAISEGVWDLDTRTGEEYHSPAYARMLGYEPADIPATHQGWEDLIHPDDRARALDTEQRFLRCPDDAYVSEYRLRAKDGDYRWVLSRGRAVEYDRDGRPLRVVGVHLDITERKTRELELETVFTAGQVGILHLKDGRFVHRANQRLADILGYESPELLVGQSVDIFHLSREHFEDFGRSCYEPLAHGERIHVEYRLRRADGSPFWALLSGKAVDQALPADLEKGVIWMVDDLTERKEAEQALERSHATLLNILDSVPAHIYVADMDSFEVLFMNKAMREAFGGDHTACHCWEVFRGEKAPCPHCTNERLLDAEGNPAGMLVWEDKNPKTGRWYLNYDQAIRWADGRLVRIQIATDLTERKKAEEALRAAKEQAQTADRAKSEFLANMSHEIRTPLNGVMGMLQLMTLTPLTDEQREYVQTALTSGRGLLAIISDILDLSKVEAGRLDIEPEPFDPATVIMDVAAIFRPQAEAKGLAFTTDMWQSLPGRVHSDPQRFRQILFNLVGNAVKFTDQGGVSVAAGLESGMLTVVVADTGLGLTRQELDTVFEAFTQADGTFSRRHQGTGLGLTISRRLAELLGGTIALHSDGPGLGATATLRLPPGKGHSASESAPKTSPETAKDRAAAPTPPRVVKPRSDLRILVVEDDPVSRILVERLLAKLGHAHDSAHGGPEALDLLERSWSGQAPAYDAVLLDIQMPGMDGYQVAERVQKRAPDLPILALTAHAMQGDREKALEAGFSAYLAKPVILEDLRAALADLTKG